MITLGNNEMTKAFLGTTEVKKICLGSEQVWPVESALPYDAEVEYLESTGTQYINLPMTVAAGTYFSLEGEIIPVYKNSSKYSIFSASPYAQFEALFYSYNSSSDIITYNSTVGGASASGGWGGTAGTKKTFGLSTTGKTSNSTFTALSRPLKAKITAFRIFGGYRNSNRYPVKFGKLKITAGDNVLYDLVPVRAGTVGYMYDKVSGQLLGNNGTGSFVLGNDVN